MKIIWYDWCHNPQWQSMEPIIKNKQTIIDLQRLTQLVILTQLYRYPWLQDPIIWKSSTRDNGIYVVWSVHNPHSHQRTYSVWIKGDESRTPVILAINQCTWNLKYSFIQSINRKVGTTSINMNLINAPNESKRALKYKTCHLCLNQKGLSKKQATIVHFN
jgi:hypothetical protein